MSLSFKNFYIVNESIKSINDDDGTLYIKGIANTGERDLVGDVITQEALQEIAEQAVNRNLHFNHNGQFDDTLDELTESIIGVITDAQVISEGVEITARILPKHVDNIKYFLENGVKLGLSVSGKAHYEENSWEQIESWDLTEISLTAMPCDQGTMGTVEISKSFSEFISLIPKNNNNSIGGKNMADEGLSREEIIELINAAFNEKEEELLETVRKENEQKFDEIITRLESLENQKDDGGQDDDEGDAGGEGKSGEGDGADNPDDDEDKNIEDLVNKRVEQTLQKIFGTPQRNFSYNNTEGKSTPDDEEGNGKKSYTPRQIAEIITGGK